MSNPTRWGVIQGLVKESVVLIHQTQAYVSCRSGPLSHNKSHFCLLMAMSKKDYFISSNQRAGKTILLHPSKIKDSPLQKTISHILQRGLASLSVSANSQTNLCAILVHTADICGVINFFRCDFGDHKQQQNRLERSETPMLTSEGLDGKGSYRTETKLLKNIFRISYFWLLTEILESKKWHGSLWYVLSRIL